VARLEPVIVQGEGCSKARDGTHASLAKVW
jgi:hypothetical protein